MNDTQPVRIEIYSDTICPWCFIGKRRFETALELRPEVEVQVTWMPFQLNPDMPAGGMDRQDYLERKFGGAAGARQVYAPIEEVGHEEGIAFAFEEMLTTPNTLDSHRLIHYAKSQPSGQDSVVEALFESYFVRGENIGDLDVLTQSAVQAGIDADEARAFLESDTERDQIASQDSMARSMGIQGVPFFVFERKYAVSGAQPPEVIAGVFDTVVEEAAAASGAVHD